MRLPPCDTASHAMQSLKGQETVQTQRGPTASGRSSRSDAAPIPLGAGGPR